ncbi:glycoside hydrolase superfamily [Kockovaella imperatae]|uniref:Glycoside hydrolase superfamily n=1 Tax=Kockovaella imperatae TaxID=4999 RepID=A0A1Y1UIR7_9TREE|nr:glycoside hydrolase superfamily [Kockovaella imperatae]ORX37948.1 glycoside hydrolase superfamily [Kockovaella imperatae]
MHAGYLAFTLALSASLTLAGPSHGTAFHRRHHQRAAKAFAQPAGQPRDSPARLARLASQTERDEPIRRRIIRAVNSTTNANLNDEDDCDDDDDDDDDDDETNDNDDNSSGSAGSEHAAHDPIGKTMVGTTDTNDTIATCATNGEWMCQGKNLLRCNHTTWVTIAECAGDNLVCSAAPHLVGCVWSWDLSNSTISTNTSTVSGSPSGTPSPSATHAQSGSSSNTNTNSNTNSNTNTNNDGDDDDDDDDDEGDCDDDDDTPVSTSASSAASATITVAPSASHIGGNLWAGASASASESEGDAPSATSHHGHHHKSKSQDDSNWSASASESESASASASDDSWGASTTDSASASTTTLRGHGHKSTSTASPSPTGYGNGTSGGGGSNGKFAAPHYVIYADDWLDQMPSASDIGNYNRFILAFWMSDQGAVDDAQAWEQFSDSYRQQVLDEYHAAGIALMVSAFGSTDAPTSWGVDPTQCATDLANWVQQYGLDGVDIDYEDMSAMNNDQAESWIITFQQTLRQQLGDGYLISHAPVAPWFTSANVYAAGAYVNIWQTVGDTIDFLNLQFYNQGDIYTDCQSLIFDSGSDWPDTSVMQINSYAGVPLDKIVIGKPNSPNAADNGYMSPDDLATCVSQAVNQGWNGGVMFWEWEGVQNAQSLIANMVSIS